MFGEKFFEIFFLLEFYSSLRGARVHIDLAVQRGATSSGELKAS